MWHSWQSAAASANGHDYDSVKQNYRMSTVYYLVKAAKTKRLLNLVLSYVCPPFIRFWVLNLVNTFVLTSVSRWKVGWLKFNL